MIMNPKLYVLARVELQLSSLNASGAVGNYIKLQEGYVIVRTSKGLLHVPVPVINGNALKNWHARAMAEIYVNDLGGENIHNIHFSDMMRISLKRLGLSGVSVREVEEKIIRGCAICDAHGYLVAERIGGSKGSKSKSNKEEEEEKAPPKRDSLININFATPIEEEVRDVVEKYIQLKFPITHNRVSSEFMMLFHREYASAIYGWNAFLDIASIGRSQFERDVDAKVWLGRKIIDDKDEIIRRAKAAILAFRDVLSGRLGANRARSLPVFKPVDVAVILSNGSIPAPIPSFYEDYAKDLSRLLRSSYNSRVLKVYCLNQGSVFAELQKVYSNEKSGINESKLASFETYYELLDAVASDVEVLIRSSQ